jgi:hypothetical protein
MLASTVQFSSYGRDPDPVPGAYPRLRAVHPEGRSAPAGTAGYPEGGCYDARSLRTQQRAKPPTHLDRCSAPANRRY